MRNYNKKLPVYDKGTNKLKTWKLLCMCFAGALLITIAAGAGLPYHGVVQFKKYAQLIYLYAMDPSVGFYLGDSPTDAASMIPVKNGKIDGRDLSVDGAKLDAIESAATADQTAAEVANTPAGDIAATDVQGAIDELDTEKEPVITQLSAAKGGTGQDSSAATGFPYVTAGTWSFLTPTLNSLSDCTITTPAQGDILYYNGSAWVNLAAGTSGMFLETQGAGANPIWGTPGGGGDMLEATYDPAGLASQVLTETGTQNSSNKTLILPKILNSLADNTYIFGVSALTANRTITLPLLAANDEFVFKDHPVSLANKTLVSPIISGATITTPAISGATITTPTITGATTTSPTINTSVSGTAILDEDDLASDSATQLATQQSIKAYVDNFFPGAYLPLTGGNLTGNISLYNASALKFYSGSASDSYSGCFYSVGTTAVYEPTENGAIKFQSKNGVGTTEDEVTIDEAGMTLKAGASINEFATAVTDDDTHGVTAGAIVDYFASFSYVPADGSVPFTAVQSGVTPTADAHLATKGYVDGFLPLTGGTLTGNVLMAANKLYFQGTGSSCYLWSNATDLYLKAPKGTGGFDFGGTNSGGFPWSGGTLTESGLQLSAGARITEFETAVSTSATKSPTSSAVYAKTVVSNTIKNATAADQTHTMPELSASIDGYTYRVGKYGQYKCTVQPGNTTDSIADSGAGYGVETLDSGQAFVTLLADNTNKKWHIVENSGRWAVEGLKHYFPFEQLTIYRAGLANYSRVENMAGGYFMSGYNQLQMQFYDLFDRQQMVLDFDGLSAYVKITNPDSTVDMFGSLTDDWTLSIMVKFDNATISTNEDIVAHYEDANNFWVVDRDSSEYIRLNVYSSGSLMGLTSSITITDTSWHQLDFVKVANKTAVYIDGVYKGNATLASADTYTGSLYFGQKGDSSYWLDGSLSDFVLVNQNLYGVDPTDSGSTVPVKIKPFGGIYK